MMKRVFSAAVLVICLSLTCALAQDTDSEGFWFDGGSTTVTPGTPFTMDYYAYSDLPIRVRIYRLSLEQAIAFVRGERRENGDPVWDGSVKTRSKEPAREISVGPFETGFYEIRSTLGRTDRKILGSVTTLGLLRVHDVRGGAAWAIDLRTFRRHQGPTKIRVIAKNSERVVRADVNGLALLPAEAAQTMLVAQTADGSADIWAPSWTGDAQPHQVDYVQTDRPVYRPGQTVNFRAIVRAGFEDAYRIPSGKHRIEITDENGAKIYDRSLALSRFGTIGDAAQLPQSARLGNYAVAIDGREVKWFSVQAYKKPEYVVEAQRSADSIVSGDSAAVNVQARYLFGRPAAGMRVHYRLWSGWYWYRYYDPLAWNSWQNAGDPAHLPKLDGEGVTDASGQLRVRISTQHVANPYAMTFDVEARDDSGRTVSTSTSMIAYPSSVRLDLSPSLWFANRGDDVALTVKAADLQGKAVAGARVQLTYTRELWDARERKQHVDGAGSADVITAADGVAIAHWRPQESGSYDIVARTRDQRGNESVSSRYVWVMGGDESWMPPTEQPVLVPAHETLATDERPRVLVRLPAPGRDVLIAVVSDRVRSLHVLHVTGYTASLRLDAPPNASQFTVQAFLPSENGIAQAQVQFHRETPKRLHIVLRADRARYEPEARANIDAYVTDASGKPVRSEVSIGIVDDAIYAVQSDDGADPVAGFYANTAYVWNDADWYRPNYLHEQYVAPAASEQGMPEGRPVLKTIAKISSRAVGNLVRPGTTADVYGVNGGVVVRRTFLDTAYWTPAVMTDARGHARISLIWPDNLTTWRTSALGVTAQTAIGSARLESLVTKDFLVRLETPRFLRAGDTTTITGIAQGQKTARSVHLKFEPKVDDPITQALELDANASASASWQFDAGSLLGNRLLTLTGSDGVRADAMQLPLPIESAGSAEHLRDAGDIAQSDSVSLSVPAGYDPGTLHITLTPSVIAQLLENVRMLDVYPYYCTEQTMSAALPAVFVDRMFERTGSRMPSDVSPPKVIAHAIDRLAELQHADGSWGWWETDAGHPFMTAYAMYGLAEFRKAGYTVPASMFERGLESLETQLAAADTDTLRFWGGAQAGSEWNTRAFMLFALADADPLHVDRRILNQTLHHARGLNSYALAVLGLAYHELGDDATARRLRDELNGRALSTTAYTYWIGATWHYAWEDDPIETTAYALRLNAAVDPNSPIVPRVIAFLRSEQRGSWWYTTKDTAAAVYAISEAEQPAPGEFHPDEVVTVLAGDRVVKTLHITTPVLTEADAQVDVPASVLSNGTVVRFVRSGRGALYWATDFTRYAPWSVHAVRDSSRSLFARLFPKAPPLQIERTYTLDHAGPWRVGDVVHVHVRVRAREDVQYVAVEDPFPAGVEYAPPQGQAATSNWSGVQFFDDRAVFFADEISARWPLYLDYDLRVTTPGRYSAPPPDAYAMYGPPIAATGSGEHVTVGP
ncbi:MAG TPA: MG2 domain-containing protein [Candidatus Baltobacteraceae bacterium]|nr:MG2 domain-containing protein [Candidatus Baltobacteraceae bacterium]